MNARKAPQQKKRERLELRTFRLLIAMIVIQSGRLEAQSTAKAHAPTGWIGCYTLSFDRSRAPVLFEDSATFVRFDTVPTRDGYLVRPGPGRTDRKWKIVMGDTVSWDPVGADSVTIYAAYGYYHDVLAFARRGDSLSGLYKANSDVIDSTQLHQRGRPVFGKRVPCRTNSRGVVR